MPFLPDGLGGFRTPHRKADALFLLDLRRLLRAAGSALPVHTRVKHSLGWNHHCERFAVPHNQETVPTQPNLIHQLAASALAPQS